MVDLLDDDINNKNKEDLISKIFSALKEELKNEIPEDINLDQETIKNIEERKKCKSNFFYFLENYVPLVLSGKTTKFIPHLGQEILYSVFNKYKYVIVNKTRQIGITTIARAIAAWISNFYDNIGIGVISKSGPAATDFIRETIKIIDSLPPGIKTEFVKRSEQQYILSNGSYAMAEAVSMSNPDKVLRSKPITLLIIDEAAFIPKLDIAMKGLLPTVSRAHDFAKQNKVPYGIIIMSTPNGTTGKGEWFFKKFQQAIYNNTLYLDKPEAKVFRAIELWWRNIPTFTEEWYLEQVQLQDEDEYSIAQEFDCTFLPTQKDYQIDIDIVIQMKHNIKEPIESINLTGGTLEIYKTPSENDFLAFTVDVATAYGISAYSTVEVFDYDTDEQIAEYMGKLSTDDFPDIIELIIDTLSPNKKFVLLIENNTIGEPVIRRLSKKDYIREKMYYTKKIDKDNPMIYKKELGLSTNSKTKPFIIESFFNFVKRNWSKIHSNRFYLQLLSMKVNRNEFVNKPNDLLMATAFYAFLKNTNFVEENNLAPIDRFALMKEKLMKGQNLDQDVLVHFKNLNRDDIISNSSINPISKQLEEFKKQFSAQSKVQNKIVRKLLED